MGKTLFKGRTTIKSRKRIKGRKPKVGHEERLAAYQKRALFLKRLGHYHHEIADIIAAEFELESIPAITTVADWLKAGSTAVSKDIQELQWQMRLQQFTELEKLKSKWMPLATAGNLEITRWRMEEGELQPQLDENAIDEQIRATREVVNIMARQAKLLGLDIEKSIADNGEGPGTLQELQIWLINQVSISVGAPNGQAIDIQTEKLELGTGLPEIDNAGAIEENDAV